ncbi:MAG TPA: hypothetical protein VFH45_09225 [Acidimicrobiales bacterium]|nr:hypothetical protein [Acidimicrobiales bacterium]
MARRLGAAQADLYAAEADSVDRLGVVWRRLADARCHAGLLVGSDWFAERWPHFVECDVERRGSGSVWSTCLPLDDGGPEGRPTRGVVLLADGGLRQPVLLHELAHLLNRPGAGHDRAFAAIHLTLVRHDMGFLAYAEYRRALWARASFEGVDEAVVAR